MDDVVKTIEQGGYTIEIWRDTFAANPRNDEGNLGTMSMAHSCLPNETDIRHQDFGSWDGLEREIRRRYNPVVILPVYMYDHGGRELSSNIESHWYHFAWGGGRVGFIFATRDQVGKLMGWKRITAERRAFIERNLQQELKAYTAYMNGEGYGYTVTGPDGEEVEQCCGYLTQDDAEEAAIWGLRPTVG